MKLKNFLIKDINAETTIEVVNSQKEIFGYMDQYIENLSYDFFDPCDDCFSILYNDGSEDYIDAEYDGHKIRRKNIASMVYTNSCTDVVYGNFEINEYGVVTTSFDKMISNVNIVEL